MINQVVRTENKMNIRRLAIGLGAVRARDALLRLPVRCRPQGTAQFQTART